MPASLTATRTKLIMVPKKGLTKDGDIDFDVAWGVLATALQEIHTKNASSLSFEELYRNAYKIVLKKKGDILYDHVRSFEESWLRERVRARIVNLVTPVLILSALGEAGETQSTDRRVAGERFLGALTDAFADHQICMNMITDVLMYMVSGLFPGPCQQLTLPESSLLSRSATTIDIHHGHDVVPSTSPQDAPE
jgi:cullin 3